MSSFTWIRLFRVLIVNLTVISALTACGGNSDEQPGNTPPDPKPGSKVAFSFVVLGEQGIPVARALTEASACPLIELDGAQFPMEMRAPSGTMPLRPTALKPSNSKPSVFPVSTCEKVLPLGTRSASINGQSLALPTATPTRIVVIGDTGCRNSSSQVCNDPAQHPFAQIAEHAARWKPDLVVHVGDYHYRAERCPAGTPGCTSDSIWGYGYDAWRADFFKPAEKLLRAAPWAVTRGNHESCNRAGQGWWRFLDPRPLLAARDCNDPVNDGRGDYSDPYAVPLSPETQLIVADSSNAPELKLQPGDFRFGKYQELYRKLADLAGQVKYNIALFHQPLFGLRYNKQRKVFLGIQPALQSVFQTLNPQLLPGNIHILLSGHVHTWAQLSWVQPSFTRQLTQFVAGFSGAKLDQPIPVVSPGKVIAPGLVLETSSGWPSGRFGYMTMERVAPGKWDVKAWDQTGKQVKQCQVNESKSECQDV